MNQKLSKALKGFSRRISTEAGCPSRWKGLYKALQRRHRKDGHLSKKSMAECIETSYEVKVLSYKKTDDAVWDDIEKKDTLSGRERVGSD